MSFSRSLRHQYDSLHPLSKRDLDSNDRSQTLSYDARVCTARDQVFHDDFVLQGLPRTAYEVPRLSHAVLYSAVGAAAQDPLTLLLPMTALAFLTQQRPKVTTAVHPLASFHLRPGMPLGVTTTLRGHTLERFVRKSLPPILEHFERLGVHSFPLDGNTVQFGLEDLFLFEELQPYYQQLEGLPGCQISVCTTATSVSDASLLFATYAIPTHVL